MRDSPLDVAAAAAAAVARAMVAGSELRTEYGIEYINNTLAVSVL